MTLGELTMHVATTPAVIAQFASVSNFHRGQLSVYLRELDVPVPTIDGPSADENPFA